MLFALFFLGVVQGLTEFLPVSSSGHLTLFSQIFGIEQSLEISILLHVATLLSIVVVFRKEILDLIHHPFSEQSTKLIISTILTCLIVLVLLPTIKTAFTGKWLSISFLISATLLFFSDRLSKNKGALNAKTAIIMGIAQGFSIFPGISRSGTTISAGIMSGAEKTQVTKFSFLMSIPIILASLVMEFFQLYSGTSTLSLPLFPMIVSFLTAFSFGIFAIKIMLKVSERARQKWFSIYLIFISIVAFIIL